MPTKHALNVLGLALIVALGLTAFAVPSAGAANLKFSEWTKSKISILKVTKLDLKATVTGKLELHQILVPALSIEIHCEKGSVTSAKVEDPELGEILGTFLFENCKVYPINSKGELVSTEPLPCIISNGGVNHHISANVFILVIKHEGVKYLVAEPDPSTGPFATITYEPGQNCPIPLKQELKGNYTFEVIQTEQKVLTIAAGNKALQELLGTKLVYGVNEATIIGKGTLELTGVHAGCAWGVV